MYIDEAQDYFDEAIENLLNQARKYRVGLVLAHQNLGQFDGRLAEAVMASTAIKLAGGVSAKDAWTLSRDMRCEPDFLLAMHKHRASTDFACFIRNVTPQPVALTVPFGQMEGRPRMSGTSMRRSWQSTAEGLPRLRARSQWVCRPKCHRPSRMVCRLRSCSRLILSQPFVRRRPQGKENPSGSEGVGTPFVPTPSEDHAKRRAQGLRSNRRRRREAPLNALAAQRDKRSGEGGKKIAR